jgi:phosphohistidine phosphatase SixA
MKLISLFLTLSILSISCSKTYYISRHAEKQLNDSKDPNLTEIGQLRAIRLDSILKSKHIQKIYFTNTLRTKSTAMPLANRLSIEIQVYSANEQSLFINELKQNKHNSLIIGHSNTVKYIINGLAESEVLKQDLNDLEYDKLFVVKRYRFRKPNSWVISY